MKPTALLLALCFGMAALAFGDDLVSAAKTSKAKRKKSTTRVLTNNDVMKSKGTIATTPNVEGEPAKPEPTLMEKHETAKAADRVLTEKRAASDKLIADLEKDLAAIEQLYYAENDLNRRDTELVKRFNDVRARLEAARAAKP
jgi:hypothetical protein